jgi:predicted nucleic acid-binding protein
MRTAVDTSVILDVLTADPSHGASSEAALRRVAQQGRLVVGECVLAEITPAFRSGRSQIDEFLTDWDIDFTPSTKECAVLAGEMFTSYLRRRSKPDPRRLVPDFLVGAHAKLLADRLLARDRGYFRDYFKGLTLLEP